MPWWYWVFVMGTLWCCFIWFAFFLELGKDAKELAAYMEEKGPCWLFWAGFAITSPMIAAGALCEEEWVLDSSSCGIATWMSVFVPVLACFGACLTYAGFSIDCCIESGCSGCRACVGGTYEGCTSCGSTACGTCSAGCSSVLGCIESGCSGCGACIGGTAAGCTSVVCYPFLGGWDERDAARNRIAKEERAEQQRQEKLQEQERKGVCVSLSPVCVLYKFSCLFADSTMLLCWQPLKKNSSAKVHFHPASSLARSLARVSSSLFLARKKN